MLKQLNPAVMKKISLKALENKLDKVLSEKFVRTPWGEVSLIKDISCLLLIMRQWWSIRKFGIFGTALASQLEITG